MRELPYLKKNHFMEILKDYFTAEELNNGKFTRLSKACIEFGIGSKYIIIYCDTVVVLYDGKVITLRHDGFQTVTTKKWINHGLSVLYPNGKNKYFVYQKNWSRYVANNHYGKKPIEFNNCTINIVK